VPMPTTYRTTTKIRMIARETLPFLSRFVNMLIKITKLCCEVFFILKTAQLALICDFVQLKLIRAFYGGII
jgi:hypothetical protein